VEAPSAGGRFLSRKSTVFEQSQPLLRRMAGEWWQRLLVQRKLRGLQRWSGRIAPKKKEKNESKHNHENRQQGANSEDKPLFDK
jgi:hypothetical protein